MSMQMKRPAAAKVASEPKAKKQQQEDPLVTKCTAIIAVLSTAEDLSEATLQMLEVGVRACLVVPKEGRHEVQNSVIEMIEEVLTSVEAGHAAKVDALRSKIAEADAEKAKREALAEAAVATKEEKSDAVKAAEKSFQEAIVATSAAREAHKTAVSEQKSGDADLLQADSKKALAEATVNDHVSPLQEGSAADAGNSAKTIAKVGKELGLEIQLLESAELVLRKAPAERGSFDSIVTQQLSEQFANTIAKLADLLANGQASNAERAAKVDDCSKQVDAAVAHREACKEQLEAAKTALNAAESSRKAAEQSVKDFGPETEEAAASAEAADAELVAFKADLATFTELVEGPPAAPEVAPVKQVDAGVVPAADVDTAVV